MQSLQILRQVTKGHNSLRLSLDWLLAVSSGIRTVMGIAIRVGLNPIIGVK
jgi:hypothetical protein